MSTEDFNEVKFMHQKPENIKIRPNQRKKNGGTEFLEKFFAVPILLIYCQMLSAGSFFWGGGSPKMAFSGVKLGIMPFLRLPWAKIVRNICFSRYVCAR